jgi:hypothetical protein
VGIVSEGLEGVQPHDNGRPRQGEVDARLGDFTAAPRVILMSAIAMGSVY